MTLQLNLNFCIAVLILRNHHDLRESHLVNEVQCEGYNSVRLPTWKPPGSRAQFRELHLRDANLQAEGLEVLLQMCNSLSVLELHGEHLLGPGYHVDFSDIGDVLRTYGRTLTKLTLNAQHSYALEDPRCFGRLGSFHDLVELREPYAPTVQIPKANAN